MDESQKHRAKLKQQDIYYVIPFIKVFRKGKFMDMTNQRLPRSEGRNRDELQMDMNLSWRGEG